MATEIRQPNVTLSLVSADTEVSNAPQRVLIVGQKLSTGSATANAIYNITNDGTENGLFGKASHVSDMIRAFKRIAPEVALDAAGFADPSGAAAAYTCTVTGPSTESGTISGFIGSAKQYTFSASILNGEAANDIATKLRSAVNAIDGCPFSAAGTGANVVITYANVGTCGNSQCVSFRADGAVRGTLAGVTLAISQSATGSGDINNTAINAVISNAGQTRYNAVVNTQAASANLLNDWMEGRFNVSNRVQDGVVFNFTSDTYSNVISALNALNNKTNVYVVESSVTDPLYEGTNLEESPGATLSYVAAVRSKRLTEDSVLTEYLTTTSSRDQFGGTALASLPYFNTTIPQMKAPSIGTGWTEIEIEGIHDAGGTVIGSNSNGTNTLIGEVVTTYKTDAAGNADISWKYLNYVDTMSNVREYFFNNMKKRFAQSRLTEGAVLRGRDMVNKSVFEAYCDSLYGDLSGSDFVLTQSGQTAVDFFKNNREVTIDMALGKITVNMLVPLVTQTRIIIGTIKLAFSTEE